MIRSHCRRANRTASGARYTSGTVPTAVITLQFDPFLHLGDRLVRWETVAVGGAVLVALVVAALLAGRTRVPPHEDDSPGANGHLRRDDLLFVVLGIVPGAVVGGRLAYVAFHWDFYGANRAAILDPASGGLGLSGVVVVGMLTGALVARLFDAPIGRWFNVAAVPLLLVLGLGKAALVVGGTGQGLPSGADWATRYLGPGPWGSLGPEISSHPAQAYEAAGVGIVLFLIVMLWVADAFRAADGRAFALALGGWAAVRLAVAGTWRDPLAWGPFNAEQLIDLGIAVLAVLVYLIIVRRTAVAARRAAQRAAEAESAAESAAGSQGSGLSWPDPDRPAPF